MCEEKDKFACRTCVNGGTAICENCHVIEKPSGKSSRPTNYCGDGRTRADGLLPEDARAILLVRLQGAHPLPIKLVMRYNEAVCDEGAKDGETTDILRS